MASSRDERNLKLLDSFNASGTSCEATILDQAGYQKIDDLTVLERKVFPLLTTTRNSDHAMVRVDVYDFNNYTVTTYNMSNGDDNAHLPPVMRNFSEVEGKQCIHDAHRALTELGGHPAPIEEVMGYVMELRKSMTVSAPLKLRGGPG